MSPPRLMLRGAHIGCSPLGIFWGGGSLSMYTSPCFHTLNLSEYCQVGNYDVAQLTVLEIDKKKERKKETDSDIQKFQINQCMSDDLIVKKRKITNRKYIYIF